MPRNVAKDANKHQVIGNTSDLRRMLSETIAGVRSGTIETGKANAIASLSTKILQSARLDMEFARLAAATNGDNHLPSEGMRLTAK